MVLSSPLVIVLVRDFIARVSGDWLAGLAWLPARVAYWVLLGAAVAVWSGGRVTIHEWFKSAGGKIGWRLLSLINVLTVAAATFTMARGLDLETIIPVFGWLLLASLNPLVEELYWRGLLMNAAPAWPRWGSGLYSTFWFAASHPLIVGINIAVVGGWAGFAGTFFHGLVWAVVYWKIASLRWSLATRVLANPFSMAIVFGIVQFSSPTPERAFKESVSIHAREHLAPVRGGIVEAVNQGISGMHVKLRSDQR